MAVCTKPSMTASGPSCCNYFRNGCMCFKRVGRVSFDAHHAAHPDIAVLPDRPQCEREDRKYGI